MFVLGAGVIEFVLVFVDLDHPNADGWLVCIVCSSFHSVHSGYCARRKGFTVCGIRVVSGEERVKLICDVPP